VEKKGRFLAEFVGYALVLALLWRFLSASYARIPVALAWAFLRLSGASDIQLAVRGGMVSLSGNSGGVSVPILDLTVNGIFFLALSLAGRRQRGRLEFLKLVGIGVAVLLALQALVLALTGYGFGHQGELATMVAKFLGGLACFFLPILLWMLLFYFPHRASIPRTEA
jgi:hypothetical protein